MLMESGSSLLCLASLVFEAPELLIEHKNCLSSVRTKGIFLNHTDVPHILTDDLWATVAKRYKKKIKFKEKIN